MNNTLKIEIFYYLDALRDSGDINMFLAGPYVSEVFDIGNKEAWAVTTEWATTFDENKIPEERVEVEDRDEGEWYNEGGNNPPD